MVDNFNELKNYLQFEEDKFYYLQLLARKKDNPSQSKHVKVVREYFIDSKEYYEAIEGQVKHLCHEFNARAYLRLNRRSYKKITFHMMRALTDAIEYGNFHVTRSLFSTAAGKTNDEQSETKRWIVDIDGDEVDGDYMVYARNVAHQIRKLHSTVENRDYKIYGMVQTPNGCHIITNPFNLKEFKKEYPDIDVHKDNPTILFAL